MSQPAISLRQMGAGPAGKSGYDGWTPMFAVVADGDRRVQQVVGWTGGQGDIPAIGWFVGPNGFVETVSEATDIRGPKGDPGRVITPGSVTNDLLAPMPAKTILGNATAAEANAGYLTPSEVRALVLDAGSITTTMLADGAVTSDKITTGAVTSDKITTGAVTSDKITTGAVSNDKLASMVAGRLKGLPSGALDGPPQDLTGADAWGIVGSAGKATTEQAENGIDDTQFMTSAKVLSAIQARNPALLLSVGWQKLPSGLILQWGIYSGGVGGASITFPITFPAGALSIVLTEVSNTTTHILSCTIANFSASGFSAIRLYLQGSGAIGYGGEQIHWMALGV